MSDEFKYHHYEQQQAKQIRMYGIEPDYDSRYQRIREQFIRSYARFIAKTDFDLYDEICYEAEDESMYYSVGARSIHLIKDKIALNEHKRKLKNITEELIAAAMHPSRIQTQMSHFDDIESYFEALACY